MTAIQQQAIQLIHRLPDEKIQAIITLASDELSLMAFRQRVAEKKEKAFARLETLNLNLPEDFDAESELHQAMEEKYGITD